MAPQQQSLPSSFRTNKIVRKRQKIVSRTDPRAAASRFGNCPLCDECFPMHVLIVHAESCLGRVEVVSSSSSTMTMHDEVSLVHKKHPATIHVETSSVTAPVSAKSDNDKSDSDSHFPWWKGISQPVKINDPLLPNSEPLPGLFLFNNFITKEEEAAILTFLDDASTNPWKHGTFNGSHVGKRWGVHCNLRDRRVGSAEHELPSFVADLLIPRLHRIYAIKGIVPNEANAIDYRREQGHFLTHHVDDRKLSKEPIANLSLAGDCYMVFNNEASLAKESVPVLLEQRTLQVLTGKARYCYSHGIANCDLLSDRRVSITMRESPMTTTRK